MIEACSSGGACDTLGGEPVVGAVSLQYVRTVNLSAY